MSVGLLYRYVPSKRAVVIALYNELSTEYARRAARMPPGKWRDRFVFALNTSLRVLKPHEGALRALTPALVGDPEEGIFSASTDSQELPLSYGPVGIVNGHGAGNSCDEQIVTIGRGRTDFERARDALMAWKMFDIGWVTAFPPHAPVAVGTVVAVLIRHLGFWSLNACRVLYHVGCPDDEARFGFAYGTLTNHAEAGEELFEVLLDARPMRCCTKSARLPGRTPRWPESAIRSYACSRHNSVAIQRRR